MSLRRIVRSAALLSRHHNCSRQCVRFRKPISAEATERHLDPEHHASQASMMNLISTQEGDHLYITAYSPRGFLLQNDLKLIGPTVFFPRNALKWNVSRPSDINEKSLGLFTLLMPKLDLLIIGVGNRPYSLPKDLVAFLRRKKINFEVYTTDHAIAIFNFQNNDQRWVAAAIIPPEPQRADLQDYVEGKYKHILDVSSFPIEDELELRNVQGTGPGIVRVRPSDYKDIKLDKSEIKRTTSPLGAPRNFMSGSVDGVSRNVQEKVAGELTGKNENKTNESEVETEDDKTKK